MLPNFAGGLYLVCVPSIYEWKLKEEKGRLKRFFPFLFLFLCVQTTKPFFVFSTQRNVVKLCVFSLHSIIQLSASLTRDTPSSFPFVSSCCFFGKLITFSCYVRSQRERGSDWGKGGEREEEERRPERGEGAEAKWRNHANSWLHFSFCLFRAFFWENAHSGPVFTSLT